MGLDYCGNAEFILHHATDVADPSLATVGEWRSDFVENTQLKRPLHVGFRAESGGFSVCGTARAKSAFDLRLDAYVLTFSVNS